MKNPDTKQDTKQSQIAKVSQKKEILKTKELLRHKSGTATSSPKE